IDPAVLPVASDDPHRPLRHAHPRAQQRSGREPRRHEHVARVAAGRRLHDRSRRKYLNLYPWGRAPFVPPGWDRWFAKENADESTSYYDYEVVDGGYVRHYGATSPAYATDVLAGAADAFVSGAPADRPWFLYFAPNAPHTPWIPADRYRDASTGVSPPMPSLAQMNDVRGKPGYVTSRPP